MGPGTRALQPDVGFDSVSGEICTAPAVSQYLALSSTQDEPAAVYVRWVSTKNAAQWVFSFETRQNTE